MTPTTSQMSLAQNLDLARFCVVISIIFIYPQISGIYCPLKQVKAAKTRAKFSNEWN